jgi:monofunctional chorismate mutase
MASLTEPTSQPSRGVAEDSNDADGAIAHLRRKIDVIDDEIIALLLQRKEFSIQIQEIRIGNGGTRLSRAREKEIFQRYHGALGKPGAELAHLLLRIGRGPT